MRPSGLPAQGGGAAGGPHEAATEPTRQGRTSPAASSSIRYSLEGKVFVQNARLPAAPTRLGPEDRCPGAARTPPDNRRAGLRAAGPCPREQPEPTGRMGWTETARLPRGGARARFRSAPRPAPGLSWCCSPPLRIRPCARPSARPGRPPAAPVPAPGRPPPRPAPARTLFVPGGRNAAGRAGAPRRRAQHPRRRRSGLPSMAPRCGLRGAAGSRGRAGGRAARGALTCGLSLSGGPGCGRGGSASWTCSRPWPCCSESARPPRSQVRAGGVADVGAPGPPLAAASPTLLRFGPGHCPGPARARRWPEGGDRVGPGPCDPSVPRRPFILRRQGFAPPRRAANPRAGWAGPGAGAGGARPEPLWS